MKRKRQMSIKFSFAKRKQNILNVRVECVMNSVFHASRMHDTPMTYLHNFRK